MFLSFTASVVESNPAESTNTVSSPAAEIQPMPKVEIQVEIAINPSGQDNLEPTAPLAVSLELSQPQASSASESSNAAEVADLPGPIYPQPAMLESTVISYETFPIKIPPTLSRFASSHMRGFRFFQVADLESEYDEVSIDCLSSTLWNRGTLTAFIFNRSVGGPRGRPRR